MKKIRIMLADDHKIVIEGLKSLLEHDFDLVGTAEDGPKMVAMAEKLHPDIIVVDISMPHLNGIESVRQLRKTGVKSKIVFLTMHNDATYAASAFEVGASGFVLKHSAPSELVTAIHEAMAGRIYITPMIAKDLISVLKKGVSASSKPLDALSVRQIEVLRHLVDGRSAKEISVLMNVSPRTVEFHKYRIMDIINVKTTAELIQFAVRHDIMNT